MEDSRSKLISYKPPNWKQFIGAGIMIGSMLAIKYMVDKKIYGAPGYSAIVGAIIGFSIIIYFNENIKYEG